MYLGSGQRDLQEGQVLGEWLGPEEVSHRCLRGRQRRRGQDGQVRLRSSPVGRKSEERGGYWTCRTLEEPLGKVLREEAMS